MVLSDLDRDLLSRCLARIDGAWEDFIDRYLALITHVVTSTAKIRLNHIPDEVRDDMVAEILLAIVDDDYAILRRFKGQSSLGTYLVVVARRIAARRAMKLSPLVAQPLTDATSSKQTESEQNSEGIDNTEEVKNLLSRMDTQEATAIRLFHLEHKSYRDIGELIGIPENSVGPLLSRARESMRGLRR